VINGHHTSGDPELKESRKNKLNKSNGHPGLNTIIPLAVELILLNGDRLEYFITDLEVGLVLMLI
jgi:hypothetical protein